MTSTTAARAGRVHPGEQGAREGLLAGIPVTERRLSLAGVDFFDRRLSQIFRKRLFVHQHRREPDDELRALILTGAFGPCGASVQLDEMSHDG